MRTWFALMILGAAAPARADQCAWLTDAALAERAARYLIDHPEHLELCEPCGEVVPGEPRVARGVAVRAVDDGHVQLEIDDRPVDLAYLYARSADGGYRNVALAVGCPAGGVSPVLSATPTATGIVLRAGAPLAAPTALPPPPAARPPAPVTVVALWPPAFVVFCLGWATLLAAGALWLARRRPAPMRPRAIELVDRRGDPPR